jgi:hypothetical protein
MKCPDMKKIRVVGAEAQTTESLKFKPTLQQI